MAVAAIDTQSADVMLVTEWDRLGLGYCDICQVSRSSDGDCHPGERRYQEDESENSDTRQCVGAAVKDPCHPPPET